MKQNIIITGGAGYVGASLCEALNALPEVDSIVVYDELIRNDRRFFFGPGENKVLDKVRFVRGDILDTRRLSQACQGMNVMIHLAAFVDEPFTYSQHTQYDQVNAYGALAVTRALEENPGIQRLVHLSSSAVYGFREGIDPADAPNPQNGYALSKRRGEQYLEGFAASSGISLRSCGRRIFGYNRTCRFDTLVHRMAFEALTGGRISLYGRANRSGRLWRSTAWSKPSVRRLWVNLPRVSSSLIFSVNSTPCSRGFGRASQRWNTSTSPRPSSTRASRSPICRASTSIA